MPPWMNGIASAKRQVGVGREARDPGRGVEPGRVDREQEQREDDRGDERRRLPHRAQERAPRHLVDAVELVAQAGTASNSPARSPGLARPRPRACGRSSRGRRRRASARGAGDRRPARPSASSARTTSTRPPAAGVEANPGRPLLVLGPPTRSRSARGPRPGGRGRRGRRRGRADAGLADLGLERAGSPLGDDLAAVDDPDPVGEAVGLLEVLRGQKDGHALVVGQPLDLLPERAPALRVEPGRRLVEEQDPGPVDERQGEVEPPLHAARVAADLAIGRLGEPDALDQLVAARASLGLRDTLQRRLQPHVLARGQVHVERRLLQRRADHASGPCRPRWRRRSRRRARGPSGRRQQRRQHQHRGRLPGPVGPEEAVDLARARRGGRCRPPRAAPS